MLKNYALEKVTPALNTATFWYVHISGVCNRWSHPASGWHMCRSRMMPLEQAVLLGIFSGENPWCSRFFWGKMFRVKLVIHPGPVNHEGSTYFLAYHVVPGYGESQLTRFWMVCVWGVALESPDDSGAIHLQLGFFSAFIWCHGMLCWQVTSSAM